MRGRRRGRASAALTVALSVALLLPAPGARATSAEVSFAAPTADGSLGEGTSFETAFTSDQAPARVELLSRLADDRTVLVRQAEVQGSPREGFTAGLVDLSHVPPNTELAYRFRAVFEDGTAVEGPEARVTISDDRFTWRTLADGVVTLHWYEGDEAFARRALDIGSTAVSGAATLLGVEDVAAVDFFVYADNDSFRDALGPGTRENVGGQANSDIRTMFGLIEPADVDSDWVDTLVTHELTHLVFADAVDNPWHQPPRWLNEGLAVYLSEGYGVSDRLTVEAAARAGQIIPLEGLAGLFPTTREAFSLAYAESVSAVAHLIERYGEEALVTLITSYRSGVTDDEAFTAAIGGSASAFDDEWIASLGAARPEPFGPQPAPSGPLPSDWLDVAVRSTGRDASPSGALS